jgi:hypothetical protein
MSPVSHMCSKLFHRVSSAEPPMGASYTVCAIWEITGFGDDSNQKTVFQHVFIFEMERAPCFHFKISVMYQSIHYLEK